MLGLTPHPLNPAASAGLPVLWPLILTASIALLSVLPVAICVAALVWAVAGLIGLPPPVIAGADLIAIAAVVALSVPILVRVFRQERQEAGEERTARCRTGPPGPAATAG